MIRALVLLPIAIGALAGAPPTHAHALEPARLFVGAPLADGEAWRVAIELDVPLADLALSLPLDGDADGRLTWREVAASRGALEGYVLARLAVEDAAGDCALLAGAPRLRQWDAGPALSLAVDVRCGGAPRALRYALLFDDDPGHRALAVFEGGGAAVLHAQARRVGWPDGDGAFLAYLGEGVHHILAGFDHLAFVMTLLLATMLERRDARWRVLPARGSALRAAAVASAFTLAHSLTLGLSALGIARPAQQPVEALIAASVMLAALNNVWPVVTRRHALLAFGFGLVHGFGFAGALAEIGLPAGARLTALLAFNLGVEAGQLLVLALALPLLHAVVARARDPRHVAVPASLALAALGAAWCVERVSTWAA